MCTYVRVEFWPRLCTELTLNSPKMNILRVWGCFLVVWFGFFSCIFKFIIFRARNKVFSLLQSHVNSSKKHLKNNPIHIFCLRLKIYFKHLHVIFRGNLTFSGQQEKNRNIFHLENNSIETQVKGQVTEGAAAMEWPWAEADVPDVPLARSGALSIHKDTSGRQREGWAATQDHSMALPLPSKEQTRTNPVPLGAFWLLSGRFTSMNSSVTNTGGSLELHLLCN